MPGRAEAISVPAEQAAQLQQILSGQQAEQALPAKFATGVLKEAVPSPESKWEAEARRFATRKVEEQCGRHLIKEPIAHLPTG